MIYEFSDNKNIKIGYFNGTKVIIGQFQKSPKFTYNKVNKIQNKSIQSSKNIHIPISDGRVLHLENKNHSNNDQNLNDPIFTDYLNFMTSFVPSLKREKPPVSQVTVDTHIRNIKRYLKFVEQYYTQISNFLKLSSDFKNDIIQQSLNLDVIKIYLQNLLDKLNSAQYLKLVLRSLISFIIFLLKKTNAKYLSLPSDIEFYTKSQFKNISIISELATIQTSFQHEYVFYRSREELEELNKWISLDELLLTTKQFYSNFKYWVTYLSPFQIPTSLQNYKLPASILKSIWTSKFYFHLSTLQQSSLLMNLLCSIPTPRPSNIRSICFKFLDSDTSIFQHHINMINYSVSTILEIKGVDIELISIINEYLELLYSFQDFKLLSRQKKGIMESNIFFLQEPSNIKFSLKIHEIIFQLIEYHDRFSKFKIDYDLVTFQIRYLRYKTQTSSSHEDIVFPINSNNFKIAFFEFIQPFWGLTYRLLFPTRRISSVSRSNFSQLYQNYFFPLWIDSESNVYISTQNFSKAIELKFQNWFSRASYNVTGKQITFTTLRKSMVTRSREEKWERHEQAALSRAMLHTLNTADTVYTKTPSLQKSASIFHKFGDN